MLSLLDFGFLFCNVWCKESVANSKKIELFNYFGKLGFGFW